MPKFLGESRLHQHLVAAQVNHAVNMLNIHRALIHASPAGGAGPQRSLADDFANQRGGFGGHASFRRRRFGLQQRPQNVLGVGTVFGQAQGGVYAQTVTHPQVHWALSELLVADLFRFHP